MQRMGTAERDYSREAGPAGDGPFAQLTPVVKWLLIANLVIYFGDVLFFNHALRSFGGFSIPTALGQGRVWEFFTFQFLHGSVGHVLFNSIGLFFFGPWMERHWGSGRFVAFYLLCGAAGAAFFTLLMGLGVLPAGPHLLVGASAGIYGILVGVAVVAPNLRVRLLIPPIELSMRQVAIAVLVIAVVMVSLPAAENRGGEAGHLGGAILGFFLIRYPRLLDWARRRSPDVTVVRPKAFRQRSEAKLRPRTTVELQQASAVDRILDKISRDGFQSLTEEEREILLNASRAQHRDS
jgi:membrane associated rhomboid family serine protease